MPPRKPSRSLEKGIAEILSANHAAGNTFPFGLMRPILPDETWSEAKRMLRSATGRRGLWYMTRVPSAFVVNEEELKELTPLEISDWQGIFKLDNPMAQQRLERTARDPIPVDLDWFGPFQNEFGVRITNNPAEQVICSEAQLLDVPGKTWNLPRIVLGNNKRHHREITGILARTCKVQGSYLGPLCVMSTMTPPIVV